MSSKQPDNFTKSEAGTSTKATDRQTMAIPESTNKDDPDILGTVIPSSWVKRGMYPMPGMLQCSAYLCSALNTEPDEDGKITLRYVHVNLDLAVHRSFEVTETRPDTYAPKRMLTTGKFPLAVSVDVLFLESEEKPPTNAERRMVWNLHENHIREETLFVPELP